MNITPHNGTLKINETGKRYGRLQVGRPVQIDGKRTIRYECICDCGNVSYPAGSDLRRGKATACGCQNKTHGMTETPEYKAYCAAKTRCNNKNIAQYKDYGGRGIKFLFESFEQFFKELGPKPSKYHTVDRIKVDRHYEPGNVRWATRREQMNNFRRNRLLTAYGKTQTPAEWARESGTNVYTIYKRMDRGLDDERAIEGECKIGSTFTT
jgi:hypothetical protein